MIQFLYSEPRIPIIPFEWPDLPPELHGLRILHLSDIHLGYVVELTDLERLIERSKAFNPDLVLVTGDIADKLNLLPDALNIIESLNAPFGSFASIGNHEYFHGAPQARRTHERSNTPLLLDSSTSINIHGHTLHLAAADDPQHLHKDPYPFLERSIHTALQDQPSDAFTILMSHRPQGFDIAARPNLRIPLTLSGHTHGMQFGLNGRSIFEFPGGGRYLWGTYTKDLPAYTSHLYTSSGVGHWFPVRINCPAEAPIIELRRSNGNQTH